MTALPQVLGFALLGCVVISAVQYLARHKYQQYKAGKQHITNTPIITQRAAGGQLPFLHVNNKQLPSVGSILLQGVFYAVKCSVLFPVWDKYVKYDGFDNISLNLFKNSD